MGLYIASYDLHNQRTHQSVWDTLGSWEAVRLLESVWLVKSALTASEIRDALQAAADSDDSVAVIELKASSYWATTRARTPGVEWLKRHILA